MGLLIAVSLTFQDYAVLLIIAVFFIPAIIALKQWKSSRIRETLLLISVYLMTGIAALCDLLSHLLDSIFLWKLGQFFTYSVFFVIAFYSLLLYYYHIPSLISFPLFFLYILASLVLFLSPDTVRTAEGTLSAAFKVNTSIGQITLLSDKVSLLGDLTQLYSSILSLIVFVQIYKHTTGQKAKTASLGQVFAFCLLTVATFWETLESLFNVPDLKTSYMLAIAILTLAYVYVKNPEYVLLSPIYIRNLLVVTQHGIPLFKIRFKTEPSYVDSVLIGGALSAIDSLMRTISNVNTSALKQIILKDRVLLVSSRSELLFMVTVSRPTRILRSALNKFSRDFVSKVSEYIKKGRYDNLAPFQQFDLVVTSFPFMDEKSMVTWDEEI